MILTVHETKLIFLLQTHQKKISLIARPLVWQLSFQFSQFNYPPKNNNIFDEISKVFFFHRLVLLGTNIYLATSEIRNAVSNS